jgi:dTDP-glucose 4,6-dehydratase
LRGSAVDVAGDGTPIRSYLYAADLAIWLWTILLRGQPGRAYNVGSEHEISIYELARLVAGLPDRERLVVRRRIEPEPSKTGPRYVPSTERARTELGLRELVGLDDAIERTVRWHEAARTPLRLSVEQSLPA